MTRTASTLLLAALACAVLASRVAALPAPAEFVVPDGFASFSDYCVRHLAMLSDAALDALYANATASRLLDALAPPRGCVPGCILPGHGTSVFAPTVSGIMWSGKCFHANGVVINYSTDLAPELSGHIHGRFGVGPSLRGDGDALRIRYPRGGAQSAMAALSTGGFALTGAADVGDFKDEIRQLPGTPGLFLGYTFVVRNDDDGPAEGGNAGAFATLRRRMPPVALRFALAQTRRGLDEQGL